MQVLSAVLLVVFAVIGIIFTVRELSLWLFNCRAKRSVLLITELGDGENAEQILRSVLTRQRWSGAECAVCLDCGLDDGTRRACEAICRESGCGELISKTELIKRLEN